MATGASEEQLDEILRRARERAPGRFQDVVRAAARLSSRLWRARYEGIAMVPQAGGTLVASNHGSYLDHFFLACRIDRPINFMAAAELFSNPVAARVLLALGAFPVRRGAHDHAAIDAAEAIVERGGLVVIYPQGGIRPSLESRPRHGVGVVALSTGAPVVPAAIVDAASLHRTGFLRFPQVTVKFGEPIENVKEDRPTDAEAERATDLVWLRVVELFGSTGAAG